MEYALFGNYGLGMAEVDFLRRVGRGVMVFDVGTERLERQCSVLWVWMVWT